MLENLKNTFRRRAGRAQAEREIWLVSEGRFSPKEMEEAIEGQLSQFAYRNDYKRAYPGRWFGEGWGDAKKGRSRSEKFRRPDYDWGWMESMRKLRSLGFRHSTLESEYQKMVKRNVEEDGWGHWDMY